MSDRMGGWQQQQQQVKQARQGSKQLGHRASTAAGCHSVRTGGAGRARRVEGAAAAAGGNRLRGCGPPRVDLLQLLQDRKGGRQGRELVSTSWRLIRLPPSMAQNGGANAMLCCGIRAKAPYALHPEGLLAHTCAYSSSPSLITAAMSSSPSLGFWGLRRLWRRGGRGGTGRGVELSCGALLLASPCAY